MFSLGDVYSFRDYFSVASVQTPNFRRLKPWQLPQHVYGKETIRSVDHLAKYAQRAIVNPGPSQDTYEFFYDINVKGLGLVCDRTSFPDSEADDPSQKAISNLIQDITQQKAHFSVFMAEADKTAAHLAHTATRLYNALRALKSARFGSFLGALGITGSSKKSQSYARGMKSNFGTAGRGFTPSKTSPLSREEQKTRFGQFTADTWLEYSYGWKPLLQDVFEHAEAFANAGIQHSGCLRVGRGRSKTEKVTNYIEPHGQLAVDRKIKSTKWIEYKVWYQIPDGVLDYAAVFGLNNPLSVAWEVVPFSFVADWFIPIGTALENITAYDGLQFHHGMKSIRHVYYHDCTLVAGVAPFNSGGVDYYFMNSNCRASYENIGIARELISTFPSFGFPKWKDPRSFAHAASAIALLKSIFLR
jgi:hypothetical protein